MTADAEGCWGCGLDQKERSCRIADCCKEIKIENTCPCKKCVVKIKCRVLCYLLVSYADKVFKQKGVKKE